ncbi:MAG TPA: hypothetical protein VK936_11665, partial [Longimicrobiales bacterium]|nr:hypothetical protein [Longimicrobiales bacterium]
YAHVLTRRGGPERSGVVGRLDELRAELTRPMRRQPVRPPPWRAHRLRFPTRDTSILVDHA